MTNSSAPRPFGGARASIHRLPCLHYPGALAGQPEATPIAENDVPKYPITVCEELLERFALSTFSSL